MKFSLFLCKKVTFKLCLSISYTPCILETTSSKFGRGLAARTPHSALL